MIKITAAKYLKDHKIEVSFSDGVTKIFDYAEIVGFDGIAEKLKDLDFFKSFKIESDGSSIGWEENGEVVFDNCPNAMRYYWLDESKEWEGFDDSIGLHERKKIVNSKKIAS